MVSMSYNLQWSFCGLLKQDTCLNTHTTLIGRGMLPVGIDLETQHRMFNTLSKIGWHFAFDNFKCISFNQNLCLLIQISPKFVFEGASDNKTAYVLVMAWHQATGVSWTSSEGQVPWPHRASNGLPEWCRNWHEIKRKPAVCRINYCCNVFLCSIFMYGVCMVCIVIQFTQVS